MPERPGSGGPAAGDGPVEGARHVVLVGLMGVGKTTVGRRLAKELARPFADVDEQVELRAGRVIPDIFRHDGEEAFRRAEAEVLAELVARPLPLVLAGGGGRLGRGGPTPVAGAGRSPTTDKTPRGARPRHIAALVAGDGPAAGG